ncbi:hypothetical protein HNR77_002810 [Paenibacillus sp. JGP012]|uniref:hypothetical protein n=1 Tax=Paenibacillus sp. JGP012 TaxID=2735914 RepID=UPI0016155D4C|nr:hypothetical protein [Paenibacillus sp. JGP012]MBB6021715.1 hypothetical protein [Paenibacillus sp. JGP012]
MRVLIISLVLLGLSSGFVILMDLLIGLPLYVSISNVTSPFLFMKTDEWFTLILVLLYVIGKPVITYYVSRK